MKRQKIDLKIVVFGSSQAASFLLKKLATVVSKSNLMVVSPFRTELNDWHTQITDVAAKLDIPVHLQADYSSNTQLIKDIQQFKPDLIFSVYYAENLPEEILALPRLGCVNFHASFLPDYRGFAPLIWAVINNEKKTGVSAHFVTKANRYEPLIRQAEIRIGSKDTGHDMHRKAARVVERMCLDVFDEVMRGSVSKLSFDKYGSYYSASSHFVNQIAWDSQAILISNIVRALTFPLPGAYTYLDDQKITILDADVSAVEAAGDGKDSFFGKAVLGHGDDIFVQCNKSVLRVSRLGTKEKAFTGKEFWQRYCAAAEKKFMTFRHLNDDLSSHRVECLVSEGGSPISDRFINFGVPNFGKEEEDEILDTLRSRWIGMGKKTIAFEQMFAGYCQNKWALSVSSCTAALHLSLLASKIGPGDEVITTPFTFAATINAIEYTGARPVFVDIDPETFNISSREIKKKLTKKTKAILPVHFGGLPVDMDAIEKLAADHKIAVVYDAAHAVGAMYRGKKIGSGNHLSCFSFYANKNMSTGEGGMITGSNEEARTLICSLRQHGLNHNAWQRFITREFIVGDISNLGFKYNYNDLQASLGIVQLRKLDGFSVGREEIARYYDHELAGYDFITRQYRFPSGDPKNKHALHLYMLVFDMDRFKVSRNQIASVLREENIGVAVHYVPIFKMSYYQKKYGLKSQAYPAANRIGASCLTLPISAAMTVDDAAVVIQGLKKVFKYYIK